ncbi:MAG: hypothetical protein HYS22_07235 [Deltaproteobacteria bacterium]|nr:hypothetical protein [Deltaproteobacteria bacterium]
MAVTFPQALQSIREQDPALAAQLERAHRVAVARGDAPGIARIEAAVLTRYAEITSSGVPRTATARLSTPRDPREVAFLRLADGPGRENPDLRGADVITMQALLTDLGVG